jgi:hypothetical protein
VPGIVVQDVVACGLEGGSEDKYEELGAATSMR